MDTEESMVPAGAANRVITFSTRLDAPAWHEQVGHHLGQILQLLGLQRARIGFEGDFEAVAPGHGAGEVYVPAARTQRLLRVVTPDASLVDATPSLEIARAVKTPREIEKLRPAARVAAFLLGDRLRALSMTSERD